jgi:hypothetical protein
MHASQQETEAALYQHENGRIEARYSLDKYRHDIVSLGHLSLDDNNVTPPQCE